MLDPDKEKPLSTTFDNQLIELDSIDSTNNYAMGRIHAGLAPDGLVCLAHHQWAGKGQRGKSWVDEPGQNLMMSLVIHPAPLQLSQQFLFSAAVALGILDFIQTIKEDNWRIKWPNDIYWNDRKAGGVLVENVIRGKSWLYAVAGLGLNLNQNSFPPELPHAVSLKQITSMDFDPVRVAQQLVPAIQNRITLLRNSPNQVLLDFNHVLYKKNKPIAMRKGSLLFIASVVNVDQLGVLHTDVGAFGWGEVEFVDRGSQIDGLNA